MLKENEAILKSGSDVVKKEEGTVELSLLLLLMLLLLLFFQDFHQH